MDLVEANDGSASSDPLNSSSDGSTLNGDTNPSHSQASGGINIVHVTLPQAQVINQVNTSFTLSLDAFAWTLRESLDTRAQISTTRRDRRAHPLIVTHLLVSLSVFLSGVGAIGYPAYVCHPEYT